ncbi:MAG: DUF4032 domain-containing protein [Verrucomicrobiales bacterium]|nr:DUF4032 domain-containing protein [Verrucomicrobiales bacterium]
MLLKLNGVALVSLARLQNWLSDATVMLHSFAVNSVTVSPMASDSDTNANDLVKNSSLYREFQAEREEILKHKWIESEKAGYDIGFEQALTEWIIQHRSKWRKARLQAQGEPASH